MKENIKESANKEITEKTNEVKREVVVEKRIGTMTFGVTLIIFGIILLIQMCIKVDIIKYIMMLWPAIFIAIGVETIYLSTKKNIKLKYDILSIILLCILLFVGSFIGMASFATKALIGDEDIQTAAIRYIVQEEYGIWLEKKSTITNSTNKKINVTYIEDESLEKAENASTHIKVVAKYSKDMKTNIISAMNGEYNIDQYIVNQSTGLNFYNLPDFIEEINMYITTSNKENIKLVGNISEKIV
ncbi:MAG: hypothetical protein RR702_03190 [Clostridia bacterium]